MSEALSIIKSIKHPIQWFHGIRESDPLMLDLIAMYLAIKLGLIMVALLGSYLVPFNESLYKTNLVLDIQNLPSIFRSFNTWDTQHYVLLSRWGYGYNPMSNAFYPFYPFLIWAYTPYFFNNGLIAAYIIANLFSLFVPVYMYKLCCLFGTKDQAFRSSILLLAFPTAFFMSSAYTEALYLSMCLMAFYYLFKEDVVKSSVFCFLLPLVRAQALLFLVPILVLFVQSFIQREARMHAVKTFLPPAFATLTGMLAYFAFCRWQLGGFLEGMNAQQLYIAKNSLENLLYLNQWFMRNFMDITLHLHGYTNSMLDRGIFILSTLLLVGVYRTQNKALFMYAVITLLVPALAGTFMSQMRMVLAVFPIFMYLGVQLKRSELVVIPMFALQVLFYLLHTGGYWVA